MPTTARLSHGFVFVKDLAGMIRFYEGAFGFVAAPSADPGFVRLFPPGGDGGGPGIALHTLPDAIAAEIHVTVPPRVRDDTAYKLCFATDDLDGLRAAIARFGGVAPEPWSWSGTRFCECADPEGNVVQIFQVFQVGSGG